MQVFVASYLNYFKFPVRDELCMHAMNSHVSSRRTSRCATKFGRVMRSPKCSTYSGEEVKQVCSNNTTTLELVVAASSSAIKSHAATYFFSSKVRSQPGRGGNSGEPRSRRTPRATRSGVLRCSADFVQTTLEGGSRDP